MRDCFMSWHTEVGAEDFGARRDKQFMKTYPKKAKEVGLNFTGDLSLTCPITCDTFSICGIHCLYEFPYRDCFWNQKTFNLNDPN